MRLAMYRTSGRFSVSSRWRSSKSAVTVRALPRSGEFTHTPRMILYIGGGCRSSSHGPQRLHGHAGRNLRRRKHDDSRNERFKKAAEVEANRAVADEHR